MDRTWNGHSGESRLSQEAAYFSKFCRKKPQNVEMVKMEEESEAEVPFIKFDHSPENHTNGYSNSVEEDLPIVKVCLPETSGECLQLVLNKATANSSSKVLFADEGQRNIGKKLQSKPACSEFLEASKADQQSFEQTAETGEFESSHKNGDSNGCDDDDDADGDELVYVVESQPLLPGSLDNMPLKFESDNDDKCTLGEVAEKVLEINVDDPYGLCSLLASEKEKSKSEQCGINRGRRKMLYDYQSTNHSKRLGKRTHSMLSPKNKDLRVSKLKVFKYPYKCSRCDSWFVESCDLKVHMSTHSAKSFKSVKEFIHEKIFKSPEVDKVVINAPVDFKPPPPTTTSNTNSLNHNNNVNAHFKKTVTPEHNNVVVHHQRKEHLKEEIPTPTLVYKVENDSFRQQQNSVRKEDKLYKKHNVVHSDIVYYEPRQWLPINRDLTLACSLCNMQFKNLDNLSIHMQVHNQIHDQVRNQEAILVKQLPLAPTAVSNPAAANTPATNPYKCTSCSASFGTSFNLKRHMRIHTGTRPYKCEQCQSAFITKAQLTTHMRTHTGEKPYQCDICGGKFIQQNNLKRHIMTHTGEKPFKCDKCSAAFISSSDLKRHIRVHTGEKPYKCVHCNKGFTTSGNLSSHYKMHTGEKPYKCQQCDASFSHQSNLKTHIKRHSEQPLETPSS